MLGEVLDKSCPVIDMCVTNIYQIRCTYISETAVSTKNFYRVRIFVSLSEECERSKKIGRAYLFLKISRINIKLSINI